MQPTYAVSWTEDGERGSGKLELQADGVAIAATAGGGRTTIPYDELTEISIGRAAVDRLDGRPTLVLGRTGAGPLRIALVGPSFALAELAERLALRRELMLATQ